MEHIYKRSKIMAITDEELAIAKDIAKDKKKTRFLLLE